MQEAEMIKGIRQRDEAAFSQLFDAYKNKALRTATLMVGNQADGEDIVQEAFVKCYLNIDSLKKDDYFASWFYQILTRTAWEFCRKRRRETPVADVYDGSEVGQDRSVLDCILQQESTALVMAQIRNLDVKHRMVLVLYYYNEMTVKEIAKTMNCLEGTVKSRLHTARRRLKKGIELEQIKEEEVCHNAKCQSV